MFDELQYLRDSKQLLRLLAHYAELGSIDREAWQDRLMEMEGVQARDLTRMHGELIGFQWIEQNTGFTPVLRPGAAPCCYHITQAGLRALKRASVRDEEDNEAQAA